jgi:hypothetical protein
MPWVVSSGPFDPYNQNAMKGDFPIGGGHTFLNLNLQFNSALNPREAVAGGPERQIFYNNNLVGGVELFGGDTVFQPKKWAVRATAVANYNGTALGSFSIGDANKRSKYSLEEAFVEKRLAVLSPAFDFVSVRGGMQNFTSDFRGYVFQDNQLGVRLFGNARSNRDQYNVAYFAMRDRDAFSQLHDILGNRNQDVVVANYFIQDFGAPGYTAMFNVHVNRDRAGDRRGAAPLNATYLGFHGDGRLGSWSVSHAFYQVFGSDGDSRIRRELNAPPPPPGVPDRVADAGRPAAPVDVSAQMAALELSRDADWKRYRFSVFYASGDDGADPAKAKGFDNITDNPNLAGGQFMFWTQQTTRTLALKVGEGLLTEKFSLLPNMRSKFVQRSNFVNPGIIVLNGGADFRVSPQIKVVANASYLRFAKSELLRLARGPAAVGFEDEEIGLDYSVGAKIRPFTNENLFLVAGFAVLQPRGGFATALTVPSPAGVGRLYSFFTAFQVAF